MRATSGTTDKQRQRIADRNRVADEQFQSYDFGAFIEVEDASGWEHTESGNEWVRPVYCRTDEGDDIGSSTRLVFVVRFAPKSATVVEAYAIDHSGCILGTDSHSEPIKPELKMLPDSVARMKLEIIEDVKAGLVPINVTSFSEVHDFRDANCYGGFCDDLVSDFFIEHFGGRDSDQGMPQAFIDHINAAQDAIDVWIKDGCLEKTDDFIAGDTTWYVLYADLLRKHKQLVRLTEVILSKAIHDTHEDSVKLHALR